MVLITHREFTRDPPQKWFPFLQEGRSDVRRCMAQERIHLSSVAEAAARKGCPPISEAHCPRRVAWDSAYNPQLSLKTVVPLAALAELHLLCTRSLYMYI